MKTLRMNGIAAACLAAAVSGMSAFAGEDCPAAIARYRALTDARIAEIRATPNIAVPSGRDVYYLSADGDDAKDGRTPATAWRTIQRLNREAGIAPGSFVLFRRGDTWRVTLAKSERHAGKLVTCHADRLKGRAGVTYSAYGTGPKPRFTASPFNGADPSLWQKTDAPDVWACQVGSTDVGLVVFDEGKSHGIKIVPVYHKDGTTTAQYTGRPFRDYRGLDTDLHFYHDYSTNGIGRGTGLLYLHSHENPGLRFRSVEFGPSIHVIVAHGQAGTTFDNLCVMYGGAHGIQQGGSKEQLAKNRDLLVKNCEIGWIGGGIQGERLFGRPWAVRYGNGVEVGACDGYTVTNCYVYQIYDAGLTHQGDAISRFDGKEKVFYQRRIRYVDNVIEKCNYSIEYFLSRCPETNPSRMEDFLIADNLMWNAGSGLCEQRPDRSQDAHVKSWVFAQGNRATGYTIRDNLFAGAHMQLIEVCSGLKNPDGSDSMPRLERNVFIGPAQRLGLVEQLSGEACATYQPMDATAEAYLNRHGSGNHVFW